MGWDLELGLLCNEMLVGLGIWVAMLIRCVGVDLLLLKGFRPLSLNHWRVRGASLPTLFIDYTPMNDRYFLMHWDCTN